MAAYSRALALESWDAGTWDANRERFDNVSYDDLELFARRVAFKVADNLARGSVMNMADCPLTVDGVRITRLGE